MRYGNLNIPVIQQQLKHEIWNQVPRFHPRQSDKNKMHIGIIQKCNI